MNVRQLGGSGLRVSEIALGGNTFGRDTGETQSIELIHHALDLGINCFDTADVYSLGVSEQYLGKALAGRRHEAIIATKVGNTRGTMGDAINNRGLSRKHLIDGVEASLRRLNTDYIDLYQLHRTDPTTPIEETLRALDDLVHAGKVRYLGCANFAAWQVVEALWTASRRALTPFVSTQNRYNMLFRAIEPDLLPACRHFGVGIIAFAPLYMGILHGNRQYRLFMGVLTGVREYEPDEVTPGDGTPRRPDPSGLQRRLTTAELASVDAFAALAREYGRTPSQLALAWLLAHPEVSTVISGSTFPEQLDDNVQAAGWTLGPVDLRRIDGALGPLTASAGRDAAE